MKKILSLLILTFFTMLTLGLVAACSFGNTYCSHNYQVVIIQEATCTQEGLVKYTCSLCQFSYEQRVDALGHNPAPIGEEEEATCLKEGITAGLRCTTCDTVLEEQKTIPLIDHVYIQGVCKWCSDEETYYVTFMANGQVVEKVPYTVSTKSIEEPNVPENPYCISALWESYTLGYSDITVNALYTYESYKITLSAEGGVVSSTAVTVSLGKEFNLPVPYRIGYTFKGWYDGRTSTAVKYTDADGSSVNAYSERSDKTLYAQWDITKCVVMFDSNGGTAIENLSYDYGSAFGFPDEPTKAGYKFDGWYSFDGKIAYTATTLIKSNITVYAKWIESIAVTNAGELISIAAAPDKNYHLTSNIDLKGTVWVPIDNFMGTLDGNGFTIKNFVLSTNAVEANYGFFRVNSGSIKNIKFADFTFNFSVNVTSNSTNISSVLVGTNNGTIENCELVSGSIQFSYKAHQSNNSSMSNTTTFGSIAGYNYGIINNCGNLVDISAVISFTYSNTYNAYGHSLKTEYYLGGLIGRNNKTLNGGYYIGTFAVQSTAVLSCSYMSDTYLYSNSWIGGLIGQQLSSAECLNSFSNINLTYNTVSDDKYSNDCAVLGGAVGQNTSASSVSSSYSIGAINGGALNDNIMGGFVGSNSDSSKIISCYSTAEISSTNGIMVGGFCGHNASVIQNSYSSGNVNSNKNANIGGFVGQNTSDGTLTKCYSTGDVTTAGGSSGHFVGSNAGVVFKSYYMQGANVLSGGKYLDNASDDSIVSPIHFSQLWSKDFLIDILYWDSEGWVILTDESPLLDWEVTISHNFQKTVFDPDCEHGGFTLYSCTDCGRLLIMDFIDPVGHNYVDVMTVNPTCSTDGYTLKRCSVCGDEIKTDTVKATGHPENQVTLKTDRGATCTADGYYVYHCNACDNDFIVQEEAKGHSGIYLRTTIEPTCTHEGKAVYVCGVCTEEYTVALACIEHTWIDVAYKPATCGVVIDDDGNIAERNPVAGNTAGVKCSVCGAVDYGCEIIEPHTFELVSTVNETSCSKAGLGIFRCTICEYEEEREIKLLNHIDENKDYICDVCNQLLFTDNVMSSFTHISDVNGLLAIANNPSRNFWLDADIDVTGVNWSPLGTAARPFKGIFYGNGHIISGLTYSANSSEQMLVGGLFGYNSGLILCVNISNFSVSTINTNVVFGGLVAYNSGRVINCNLVGTNTVNVSIELIVNDYKSHIIDLDGSFVGGLVAINYPTGVIEDCFVTGKIDTVYSNKSLVKSAKVTQFIWSLIYSTSAKTIQHITFGGLVGRNEGNISNCGINAEITAKTQVVAELSWMRGKSFAYTYLYAGAITGYNSGEISGCEVTMMSYSVDDNKLEENKLSIFNGSLYEIEFGYYNYSKIDGIAGIIGFSDKNGKLENIVIR